MEDRVYTIEDILPATRALMGMEKRPVEAIGMLRLPRAGDRVRVELMSQDDRKVKFWLDVAEASRSTTLVVGTVLDRKTKMQTRAGNDVLVRVEFADNPEILRHMNPDGSMVVGSHVHLDIKGHGLRWALPIGSQNVVTDESGGGNPMGLFEGLIRSCNITGLPRVEFSLGV